MNKARINNPAMLFPEALHHLQALSAGLGAMRSTRQYPRVDTPARQPDQWLQRVCRLARSHTQT